MRPIRTPLRRPEVWDRWLDLAAELGLDPGVDEDLPLGGSDDPAFRLYPVRECRAALNQLVGSTRARTPIYRLATFDGRDAVVADVCGTLDNYDDALGELRYRTLIARRAAVFADLRAQAEASDPLTGEELAVRWSMTRSTLYRWADSVAKTAEFGTAEPPNLGDDSQNDAA